MLGSSPTQFLVESLLADALLLEEWGEQEPSPSAQANSQPPVEPPELSEPPAAPQSLSKADLRRKRNRERTQLTRQTQQQGIQHMRKTVQQLTKQLDQLHITQRRDQLQTTQASQRTADYETLVETTHRLKAEKVMLKRLLIQHENAALRLADILAANQLDASTESDMLSDDSPPDPSKPKPAAVFSEFRPINRAQADASVANSCRSIALYEQNATPVAQYLMDTSAPALTFGWAVTCALRPGSFFYLCMTKKLPGVTAQQAMLRSWTAMSRPYITDESPSLRISHSALLQRLDSSTCVLGSDWHHPVKPGVCMRSISVRQCRATKNGFAVHLGTLNPQEQEQRRQAPPGIEYLDASNWHDFIDEDDGSGCTASLKILWQYDTRENLHMRVVNFISATWRWESGVTQNWKLLKL